MTKWIDLGMSHPLALGMAHPLADRLETLASPNVHKGWARGTTAGVIMGLATMSAPLTIAENHPEKSLEDTVVTTQNNKSVIKLHKTDDDGNEVNKHYEIELNGDAFEAYEFDEDGNKRKVEASEIEGFDLEDATKSNSWAFSIGEDNQLKFNSGKDIVAGKARLLKFPGEAGNKNVLRFLKNGNMKDLQKLEGLKELAELEELKNLEGLEESERLQLMKELEAVDSELSKVFVWNGDMPEPPEPPLPPGYKNEDGEVNVTRSFIFSKDTDGKAPLHFKMGDKEGFTLFNQEAGTAEAKLVAAKSMLESVEAMLKDVGATSEASKALKQAQKELEKTRKSLRETGKRLETTD